MTVVHSCSLVKLKAHSQGPFKPQAKHLCNTDYTESIKDKLLTNGPTGDYVMSDGLPQDKNGHFHDFKKNNANVNKLKTGEEKSNGPPYDLVDSDFGGSLQSDALPLSKKHAAEQPFDDIAHPYKDAVSFFWSSIQDDRPYQALIEYCKLYSQERKWILEGLVAKCYQEYKAGFKDTDTALKYLFAVEDGADLTTVDIKSSDVFKEKQRQQQRDESFHEVDGAGPASSQRLPGNRNSVQTDGGKIVSDSSTRTQNSSQGQGAWKKSEFTCKVCLDQLVSVTFVPCGHLVACVSCASALFECPVCRASIRGTIKTFF